MIFRSQLVVGAILGSIALASNSAVAKEVEQDERNLMPWGSVQGYGYTSQNNRYSTPRTRGNAQGSAYLRPNPYNFGFNAYNPNREEQVPPPAAKAAKSAKGPKGPKAQKARLNRTPKSAKYVKTGKYAGGGNANMMEPANNAPVRPQRSYLNTMHWQRVPGQPIFISQTDVPIIILEEPPTVEIDAQGNIQITDSQGNEIVVTTDAQGQPVLETPVEETVEEP